MDDQKEPLTTEDITFTVEEFMQYLKHVGRSSQCPVCPHKGEWSFHTAGGGSDNLVVHALRAYESPAEYYPAATMQCPRCGFLVHTSLIAVYQHLRGGSNG